MTDVRPLEPNEIVGHRLEEIVQRRESGGDDAVCNFAYSCFCLDSGVLFTLPGLLIESPPDKTQRIDDSPFEHIYGQKIVAVHRALPHSDLAYFDSPFLELENGYIVTDVIGSPKGIADEGVWVFAPGEIDAKDLAPFWR